MNQVHTEASRGEPVILGDHPAMDFLNSIATPVDVPVEWLQTGDDLLDWLQKTGRITPTDTDRCRRKFSRSALDEAAKDARVFREWLRQFVQKHAGKSLTTLTEQALEPLNGLLAKGGSHGWVASARNSVPQLQTRRVWSEADQLLVPLAEAAADLICHADFAMVRRCEGTGCTLFFLDVTKSHKRRWCSMAVCGNRAKAAAHRQRLRGD